jgi:hypothetical protein
MTAKIGNKHVAQHRGKKERQEIRKTNIAREAVRRAEARAKCRRPNPFFPPKARPPLAGFFSSAVHRPCGAVHRKALSAGARLPVSCRHPDNPELT